MTTQLKAFKREKVGKAAKALRRQGLVPAVIYGRGFENLNLSLDLKEFKKVYQNVGHSSVVDLLIEGEKEILKVLIADLQEEPIKNQIIHVDFHKVDLSQKVSAEIILKTVGESPAVKSGQGILLTLLSDIEVEALPLDLPHEVQVDVSPLENVGDTLSIKDLPIDPAKVKVLNHAPEDLVVKVDYAVQLEKEAEVKAVEEVEVIKEKKEVTETTAGEAAKEVPGKEETKEAKKEKR